MAIGLDLDFEALPAPRGARLVAEEYAAHVVVDADDVEPLGREKAHRFGADQSCRSRYHYHAHTWFLSEGKLKASSGVVATLCASVNVVPFSQTSGRADSRARTPGVADRSARCSPARGKFPVVLQLSKKGP